MESTVVKDCNIKSNLIKNSIVERCGPSESNILNKSGTIYHSDTWDIVVKSGFNVGINYIISTYDSRTVAVTPIYISRRFGIKIFGSPLRGVFTEFLGPIFIDKLSDEDKNTILSSQMNTLRGMNAHYIEFSLKSDCLSPQALNAVSEKTNFMYFARPSLEIDLSIGKELIWKQFESRARNMIRKSEKSGISVQVERLVPDLLAEFFSILELTFTKQGRAAPHSIAAYEALIYNLQKKDMLIFIAARYEERLVSAGVFLIDGSRLVFHSGGSTSEGFEKAASSLVQWMAIKEGVLRGLTRYDMGGLGVSSIDKFKSSFGGTQVQHHRWLYVSPILKLAMGVVEWAHRRGFIRVVG
jgi:hypothetical protein